MLINDCMNDYTGGSWLSLLKYWIAQFSGCVMIDLRGSSANMENLLRICPRPANTLKETVHSSPIVKVCKPTKTMVEVTFNTAITFALYYCEKL